MSRINTNVSSLVAQNALARSNADLQTALNRLSTGLRINVGKDDPAGLIASELLRRDITSLQKAITNTERANQLIATADSALGQVSSLLNDIRGLVTEAANLGALSDEQIAANQLQIDSSLEAIDRIAQVTTFQGRRVLDGSLDFITNFTSGGSTVADFSIEQANLGTAGFVDVSVDITAAATRGSVGTTVDNSSLANPAQVTFDLTPAGGTSSGTITVDISDTATGNGAQFNGLNIRIVESAVIADGEADASFDASANGGAGQITVRVSLDGATDTTTAVIRDAINALSVPGITFTAVETVAGAYDNDGAAGVTSTPAAGGVDGGTGLVAATVFELTGALGTEVFSFGAGTTAAQIRDAVNLVSDATGVSASVAGDTLTFTSTVYGLRGLVAVDVIDDGGDTTFETGFGGTFRSTGTDIDATVNGVQAGGDGNTLSINTAVLDLTLTVANGSSTDVAFRISGGGAVFQLGPNVVSNQQARIGITSLNTGKLGGASGRLFELRSGGAKSLATDANGASNVVDEVISKIASLRGRLGAFQRTTLESNLVSLNDTLANLTEAESSIRDADFAKESARLTRAQILVQSGTAVLTIANQNPQNVLALLR